MWQYNHTDELYHYGIPGMRWGHRKRTNVDLINEKRRAYDEAKRDYKTTSKLNKAAYDTNRLKYKNAKKELRKESHAVNENYSTKQRMADTLLGGGVVSNRVNKYLNKGDSLKSARVKAYTKTGAQIVGAMFAVEAVRAWAHS